MIQYDEGVGFLFLFQLRGSVFPKAFSWALPSALAAVGVNVLTHWGGNEDNTSGQDLSTALGSVYFALAFMLVFRTQQAYSRYWSGATLLRQVRGQWFNCTSNVFAFLTRKVEKQEAVDKFQHLFVRLMSMLYASSIQAITSMDNAQFQIIENEGMSPEWLNFLETATDRPLIVLQWVQRLIVNGQSDGVITIAPPILSRTFQELSQGIVAINEAFNIAEFPFPFPYAQMVDSLLLLQGILTPMALGMSMAEAHYAGLATFFIVFGYRCINFIGMEIEAPFGDDANDLPLLDMVVDMNYALVTLMDPRVQEPPHYQPPAQPRLMSTTTWSGKAYSPASRDSVEELMQQVEIARRRAAEGSLGSQVLPGPPAAPPRSLEALSLPMGPQDGGTGSASGQQGSTSSAPSVAGPPSSMHANVGHSQGELSASNLSLGDRLEEVVAELRGLKLLAREVANSVRGVHEIEVGMERIGDATGPPSPVVCHSQLAQPGAPVATRSFWKTTSPSASRSQSHLFNTCAMCAPPSRDAG